MKHEIASDITAAQPLDPSVERLLIDSYQFSPQYIEWRKHEQRGLIQSDLDVLEVVVANTRPKEAEQFAAYEEPAQTRPNLAKITEIYTAVSQNPIDKHAFDSDFISMFLTKLGPTNHLRRRDGIDAAFELGRLMHVLELDYDALPEAEKTPERRLTEAYLKEELALLWAPTIPGKAANLPTFEQGLIFNADDPNVFTPEQTETLSPKDRWKLIGAKLASDAADIYDAIATSETASLDVQIEALSRATDMRMRELRIKSSIGVLKSQKASILQQMTMLSKQELARFNAAWADPNNKGLISTGKLYESVALATARAKMVDQSNFEQSIRLALPREDGVSKEIYPFINRDNTLVNLSSDLIVEDVNGNFVRAYQVKAMTQPEYELKQTEREAEKGALVYPKERTELLFLDKEHEKRGVFSKV